MLCSAYNDTDTKSFNKRRVGFQCVSIGERVPVCFLVTIDVRVGRVEHLLARGSCHVETMCVLRVNVGRVQEVSFRGMGIVRFVKNSQIQCDIGASERFVNLVDAIVRREEEDALAVQVNREHQGVRGGWKGNVAQFRTNTDHVIGHRVRVFINKLLEHHERAKDHHRSTMFLTKGWMMFSNMLECLHLMRTEFDALFFTACLVGYSK